jgi:Tfp pilus assembly protein PilN
LEHALPEGARLTELKALDGQLRLTGQAASPAVVARLMRICKQRRGYRTCNWFICAIWKRATSLF